MSARMEQRLREILRETAGSARVAVRRRIRQPRHNRGRREGREGATDLTGGASADARLRAIADTLGGDVLERDGGVAIVVDRFYPADHQHGLLRIGDVPGCALASAPELSLLGGVPEPLDRAPRALLFVDLETTGLAGGAGTYAFLVGCAFFEPHGFRDPAVLPARVSARAAPACGSRGARARVGGARELQRQVVRRAGARDALPVQPAGAALRRHLARGHAAPGAALLAWCGGVSRCVARDRQLPPERAGAHVVWRAADRRRARSRDSRPILRLHAIRRRVAARAGARAQSPRPHLAGRADRSGRSTAGRRARFVGQRSRKPGRRPPARTRRSSRGRGDLLPRCGRAGAVRARTRCRPGRAPMRYARWPCGAAATAGTIRPPSRGRRLRPIGVRRPGSGARRSRRWRSTSSIARATSIRRAASRSCRWPNAWAPQMMQDGRHRLARLDRKLRRVPSPMAPAACGGRIDD